MKKKENIKLLIIVVVLSIITLFPLLIQMHYAPDTYQILTLGYKQYAKQFFLRDGRLVTATLFLIADFFNLPIQFLVIFMEFIAILALSFSVIKLYNIFVSKIDFENENHKYLVFSASYLIIFNMFALEFFLFAESGIICLSILLIICAVEIFYNREKNRYLKALILVLIATIFYQGTINLFFTLIVLLNIIDKSKKWKDIIIESILSGTILIIAFIFTALIMVICTSALNIQQERIEMSFNSFNLKVIIKSIYYTIIRILLYGFGFCNMVYFYVIMLTLIISTLYYKKFIILKYIFLLVMILSVCILPIYLMQTPCISARMCMSIGSIIGISYIFLLTNIKYKYKLMQYILAILIISTVLYTNIKYIKFVNLHIYSNYVDNKIGELINNEIKEYENNIGIIVKKVAIIKDNSKTYYTSNDVKNTFTERSTANYYCIKEVLEYYTHRKLEIVKMNNKVYNENFYDKNWNEFSKKQIVFENNIMNYCVY